MNFRDRALMLAACVVTSFVATVAVNLYFRGNAVAEDPKTADTVRMKRLEILDAEGNLKVVLSTSKADGVPVLAMVDDDGVVRYSLALNKDGSAAQSFADGKGKARVALAMNADGSGALMFSDSNGKTPLVLASSDKGAGANFSDAEGEVRASLGVDADGTPNLRWYDEDGTELKPK